MDSISLDKELLDTFSYSLSEGEKGIDQKKLDPSDGATTISVNAAIHNSFDRQNETIAAIKMATIKETNNILIIKDRFEDVDKNVINAWFQE